MKKITNYIYDKLPIYIKLPSGNTLAIWNCASRGAIGKKLTFIQNLKEIRITIRHKETGALKRVIKKGIY